MSNREDIVQLLSQYALADDDAQHAPDIYEALGEWSQLFTVDGRFDIRAYKAANLLPESLPAAEAQVGRQTIREFATMSLSSRGDALRPSMHMNFNTAVAASADELTAITDLLMLARDPDDDGLFVIKSAGRYYDRFRYDGDVLEFEERKIVPFRAEQSESEAAAHE